LEGGVNSPVNEVCFDDVCCIRVEHRLGLVRSCIRLVVYPYSCMLGLLCAALDHYTLACANMNG